MQHSLCELYTNQHAVMLCMSGTMAIIESRRICDTTNQLEHVKMLVINIESW